MMYLFEGIDKSGKSTLIKNFQDLSHLRVFKNKIKPTVKMFDRGFVNGTYYGAYEAERFSTEDLIFDRSHLTELVYAKIKRGYSPDEKFWKEWENENRHRFVVIYIDTPQKTLKERFKKEKEEYVKLSEIKKLREKYIKILKSHNFNLIYIDGQYSKQRMLSQLVIQLKNLNIWTSQRKR